MEKLCGDAHLKANHCVAFDHSDRPPRIEDYADAQTLLSSDHLRQILSRLIQSGIDSAEAEYGLTARAFDPPPC